MKTMFRIIKGIVTTRRLDREIKRVEADIRKGKKEETRLMEEINQLLIEDKLMLDEIAECEAEIQFYKDKFEAAGIDVIEYEGDVLLWIK